MTIFAGARDLDQPRAPLAHPLPHPERLARMAEADNFLPGLAEHCRRRRLRQVIAGYIAAVACAVGAAWIVSSVAVAVLLDEGRLAAMGIVVP